MYLLPSPLDKRPSHPYKFGMGHVMGGWIGGGGEGRVGLGLGRGGDQEWARGRAFAEEVGAPGFCSSESIACEQANIVVVAVPALPGTAPGGGRRRRDGALHLLDDHLAPPLLCCACVVRLHLRFHPPHTHLVRPLSPLCVFRALCACTYSCAPPPSPPTPSPVVFLRGLCAL